MNCLTGISSLNNCDIIAITNSAAILLADGLNTDDLNALGNLITAIGSIIVAFTSSTANSTNASNTSRTDDTKMLNEKEKTTTNPGKYTP